MGDATSIKSVSIFLKRSVDTPTESDETFEAGERREVLAVCDLVAEGVTVEVHDCYGELLYEAKGGDTDL